MFRLFWGVGAHVMSVKICVGKVIVLSDRYLLDCVLRSLYGADVLPWNA